MTHNELVRLKPCSISQIGRGKLITRTIKGLRRSHITFIDISTYIMTNKEGAHLTLS